MRLALAAAAVLAVEQANAASVSWDVNGAAAGTGGTGYWDLSSLYWTTDGSTYTTWPNTGNTAVFGGTAGTVTLNATGITAGGLTFNVGGYTLGGGTLTLTNGSVITTNGGTTTFASSLSLAGTSTASLKKTGSGTLALTTSNTGLGTAAAPTVWTVTGGTFNATTNTFDSILSIGAGNNLGTTPTTATTQVILDAGTLQITGTGLNPAIGSGRIIQVNAAGGAIVDSTGNPFQGAIVDNAGASSSLYLSNTSGTTTISGTISGTGGLTWSGGGALALTGSNSYTGGTTVTGGTLNRTTGLYSSAISISDGTRLGPSTGNILNLNAGLLSFNANGGAGYFSSRTINVGATGGAISDGGSAPGLGTSGGSAIDPAITIAAGPGLDLVGNNILEFDAGGGVISGSGGITVYGAGTTKLLSTANTYSGGTTLTAGSTLVFAADASLGASTGTVMLGGGTLSSAQTAAITFSHTLATGTVGGTIVLDNGTASNSVNKISLGNAQQITGSGPITVKNNGLLSIGASNSNFTGNWTLNGGVTELTSGTAAGTGSITVNSGAELSTLGSQLANAITLNAGTLAWDFYSGSGNYQGPITLGSTGGTVSLSDFYTSGAARSGTIIGVISGSGGLTTTYANVGTSLPGGVLTLSGANTYTGGTTIGLGTTVLFNNATALGSNSGVLVDTGTLNLNGYNVSAGALTLNGYNLSTPNVAASPTAATLEFRVGAGTVNTLAVSSASMNGTTAIALDTSSASALSPGVYTLATSTGGGLSGNVVFNGGENLTVPANSVIENINGINYRLTLGDTGSAVKLTVAAAPAKTLNILPLGSSITAGQSAQNPYDGGGYRSQLYENLVNDGRFTPNFVGSSVATLANSGTGTDLMTTVGQTHHEGHPGYTTTQTLNNLNGNDDSGGNDGGYWLAPGNGVNPDYVTLNIGGNDFFANPTDATAITRLNSIVSQIEAFDLTQPSSSPASCTAATAAAHTEPALTRIIIRTFRRWFTNKPWPVATFRFSTCTT